VTGGGSSARWEGEGGPELKGDFEGDVLHVVAVVSAALLDAVVVEENDDMDPQELLLAVPYEDEGHDDTEVSVFSRRSGVAGAVGGGGSSLGAVVDVSSRR